MTTATAEARLYRCPTTGGTYQPRQVQLDGTTIWCACPLHDALDQRPGMPGYDPTSPQWHVYFADEM